MLITSIRLMLVFVLAGFLGVLTMAEEAETPTPPETSGFLQDYSDMTTCEHEDGELFLLYVDPNFEWSQYKSVLIEKPEVVLNAAGKEREISEEDQKMLADYFQKRLVKEVKAHRPLAKKKGPGVLVVRAAISDAKPIESVSGAVAKVVLKVVNVHLGNATIEAELSDGETGERLVAIVDSKSGSRVGLGTAGAKKWGHAKLAFKKWAQELGEFLEEHPFEAMSASVSQEVND